MDEITKNIPKDPDKRMVIKCKLKSILDSKLDYDFLYSSIQRSNELVFTCYHFIRYFILYRYKNNKNDDLPTLDETFIRASFAALLTDKTGPKNKNKWMDKLNTFYETHFISLFKNNISKFDGENLSYILKEEVVKMAVSYKNNITLNYFKYLFQFINGLYFHINKDKLEKKEVTKKRT